MPNAPLKQRIRGRVGRIARKVLRRPIRPRHTLRWGSFRRLRPVSSLFGTDRGLPVDRYYIERFMFEASSTIKGRVLEIAAPEYTNRFGAGVTKSDVLHAVEGNPSATIIGDLTSGAGLDGHEFDCIILTQTLNVIYDLKGTVRTLHRILEPGGSVLATFPGISQISRYDMDRWGDYWRLTTLSALRLFEEAFGQGQVEVRSYGNVLAAVGMLHGLSVGEISKLELDHHDRDYEVLVCVRAQKSSP